MVSPHYLKFVYKFWTQTVQLVNHLVHGWKLLSGTGKNCVGKVNILGTFPEDRHFHYHCRVPARWGLRQTTLAPGSDKIRARDPLFL